MHAVYKQENITSLETKLYNSTILSWWFQLLWSNSYRKRNKDNEIKAIQDKKSENWCTKIHESKK